MVSLIAGKELLMETSTIDLESQALAIVAQGKALTITSPESYQGAWDFLKQLKSMQKAWEDHNAPVVAAAHAAWKAAVAARDKLLTPFGEAERFVKGLIYEYDKAQEAKRQADEKRLQDDATLAAAEQAQHAGDHQQAEALLNGQEAVPPVILRSTTPKVAGGSVRETWKARVVSFDQLIRAVSDGKAPTTLLMVNQSALDQYAKAVKQSFHVPGCQAYTEGVVSARTM